MSRTTRLGVRSALLALVASVSAFVATPPAQATERIAAVEFDGSAHLAKLRGGHIAVKVWGSDGWTPWVDVNDGWFDSGPALSVRPGILDAFARNGTTMYHAYYDKSTGRWSGWGSLGGCVTGTPAAQVRHHADGRVSSIDVFSRGCDGGVWLNVWNGSGWSGWAALGGMHTDHSPTTVELSPGEFATFAVNRADQALYMNYWAGSSWSNWIRVDPTRLSSAPSAINEGRPTIFARDMNGTIRCITYLNGWTGWGQVGTGTSNGNSPPTALRASGGLVSVFTADSTYSYSTHFLSGAWTNWNAFDVITDAASADTFIAKVRASSDAAGPGLLNTLSPAERTFVTQRMDATAPSSRAYGGGNWKVDGTNEIGSFVGAFRGRQAADARSLFDRLHGADQAGVSARIRAEIADGSLVRDVHTGQVWFVSADERSPISSQAVATAYGLDLAAAINVTAGSIASLWIGGGPSMPNPGYVALNEPNEQELAQQYAYELQHTYLWDLGLFGSPDGKVSSKGGLVFHIDRAPKNDIRRGTFKIGTKVQAVAPVGCIWVKYTWNYWKVAGGTASVSQSPGVSATVTDDEKSDGYYGHCRQGTAERPRYISLSQVGFAKWQLKSVTLELCSSPSKSEPKACGSRTFNYRTAK